jgi:hypothetical protein
MKKLLLFAAMAISSVSFAQSDIQEDIKIIQDLYGETKTDLIKDYMKLEEPKATAFWKMYDSYETERKKLGATRMQLIDEYVTNFETITDEQANKIAEATLKNNRAYDDLYEKYYRKAKKILGATDAVKFIQLETALQTAIKAETLDAIPFIGEIERTKK